MKPITLIAAFVVSMSTGCSSTNPAKMTITPRDRQVYVDDNARGVRAEREFRIAVLVKINNEAGPEFAELNSGQDTRKMIAKIGINPALLGVKGQSGTGKKEKYQLVSDAMDSALTQVLADFEFFAIVERSNLDVLIKEQNMEFLDDDGGYTLEIPDADYLVVARINQARVQEHERQTIGMINNPQGITLGAKTAYSYSSHLNVDLRFYEKATKRTLLIRNFQKSSPEKYNQEDIAMAKLAVVASDCAKDFAFELGMKYAPAARVLETRGKGRIAKINIGKNYGLARGARVKFAERNTTVGLVGDDEDLSFSTIGYGVVIEAGTSSSWCEVLDPGDANVMRGHYARLTSSEGVMGLD